MKSTSVNPTTDRQGQQGAFPLAAGSPSVLPCPKCGSADIYRLHAEAGEVLDLSYDERSTRRVNEYVHIDGWTDAKVKKECIRHHCRCCQYDWETGVLENTKLTDAPNKGPSPER